MPAAPGATSSGVEASLRRLGTDRIDLYQLHAPDPLTPIDETLSALDDLVRTGKVRYIGHSNFAGWQIADADWTRRPGADPLLGQNDYNLLRRDAEREVIRPAALRPGLLPFFPLANGLLTGKYQRDARRPGSRLAAAAVRRSLDAAPLGHIKRSAYTADRGLTMVQVAFGWLAARAGGRLRHRRRHHPRAGTRGRRRRSPGNPAMTTSTTWTPCSDRSGRPDLTPCRGRRRPRPSPADPRGYVIGPGHR